MKFIKLTVLLASAILAWACSQTPAPNVVANNPPVQPASTPAIPVDMLAGGRTLYMDNCAVCHKEDGTGGKMEIDGKSIRADDLTSAKIKAFSDEKITGYIYKGIPDEGMPAFKDKLSEAEIREVVAYVQQGIQKK